MRDGEGPWGCRPSGRRGAQSREHTSRTRPASGRHLGTILAMKVTFYIVQNVTNGRTRRLVHARKAEEEGNRTSWLAVTGWPLVRRPRSQLGDQGESEMRRVPGAVPRSPRGCCRNALLSGQAGAPPTQAAEGTPTLGRCREEPARDGPRAACPTVLLGNLISLSSMGVEAGQSVCGLHDWPSGWP